MAFPLILIVGNDSHFGYIIFVRIIPIATAALSCALLGACGTSSSSTAESTPTISVAASFYPLQEIVHRVGGDHVRTIALTPPGQGAHDVQLTAKKLTELSSASLVLYMGDGFQPDVEKAVKTLSAKTTAIDVLDSITLLPLGWQLEGTVGVPDGEVLQSGKDPHVWLDPANMIAITRAITDAMSTAHPEWSSEFANHAAAYIAELETLGNTIDTSLAHCDSDALVTSHRAFAYLAKRANLVQVAIAGVNPEEEPSAQSLEAIATYAKKAHVSTIFFETLLPADLAKTLADKVGATSAVLDPVEGISSEDLAAGATYISIMQANVARIATGLRCS